jgi:hypothetical protein
MWLDNYKLKCIMCDLSWSTTLEFACWYCEKTSIRTAVLSRVWSKDLLNKSEVLRAVLKILSIYVNSSKFFFYSPIDAQVNCLKNNFKIYIKTAPTCSGVVAPSSGSALFVEARIVHSLMFPVEFCSVVCGHRKSSCRFTNIKKERPCQIC